MRMRYEPDEAELYEAAKDLLIRRGLAWAEAHGLPADGFVWSAALDFRHDSTDGRLGHWTITEVGRLLLHYIPSNVTSEATALAEAPA
ncbi:hypothetical protein [Phytomonospora endophytica]|uniref:Uncharacterized protein n=1 Tax=Phytomonospora endophytica TaxID=714109 RepID=A0A841FGF7_9ACTN|nr:hypothetical protein [Phytomonospora endophytica]MBB6032928.1 hypothetical protein [Phytomonospora endophytica]GIG65154.1 hypothetical protein Pen01_14490 [Phytomonospora endophytica]